MLATIFVVLMILALFGGGYAWRSCPPESYPLHGAWFLVWLCLAIVGWVVFGGHL